MTGEEVLRTVAAPATVELPRISGSRFVGHAAPAASEDAALAVVDACREEDPDATHHCWAYVLADGRARSSDDGEPRDTAGAPILRHLQGSGLADVVVVVTRWYGGTNLGRGGLVRAYGDAAAAVLDAVAVVEQVPTELRTLEHDYALTGAVDAVLAAHDVQTVDAEYGAAVRRVVAVPARAVEAFTADLRDATAGRVTPT